MTARKLRQLADRAEAHAAWVAGRWSGKVVGFVLGMGVVVLLGWLK